MSKGQESAWIALAACAVFLAACDGNSSSAQAAPAQTAPGSQTGLPAEKVAQTEPVQLEVAAALPGLDGAHFATFDLLHNRPNAHRVERLGDKDVFALDAGGPDFMRYVHGNHPNEWITGASEGGEAGAGVKGTQASVWVPAWHPEGAQVAVLRLFNNSPNGNSIKLKVNGKDSEVVKLGAGWQTVRVQLPAGALKEENQIDLVFGNMGRVQGKLAGGLLGWMRLGPADVLTAEAVAKLGAPSALPSAQDALELNAAQGAIWTMWAQPRGKLDLGLKAAEGCGVQVTAWVEDGKGGVIEALREERLLVKGRGGEQTTAIDLSKVAGADGQVMRLQIIAAPTCKDGTVTLTKAAQVVPGDRPVRGELARPKYLLFWMIDTLRADHVPWIGKTDVVTPTFSAMAEGGVVFTSAFVQGNESKASHASLFTAFHPSRHNVLGKSILKPEQELMTEAIQKAGYKTCGHSANGWIGASMGFEQGWDDYTNTLREIGGALDGVTMARYGIKCFKDFKGKNLFVYVGTIDPHVTYRAHDEYITKYDGPQPYNGPFKRYISGEDLGAIKSGSMKIEERDKKRVHALYKNEIEFNDFAFSKIKKYLEDEGMWEDTMVVIASDHGDEFWEHGSVGHGHSVYQDQVHIPLMFFYPPLFKQAQKIMVGADIMDVYPTIIDILGKERPKGLQGKSLLPVMLGQTGYYPEPAVATHMLLHHTLRLQQWKVNIRRGAFELFDVVADPTEQKDVKAAHPLASRWTLDALGYFRAHQSKWDKQSWGVASNLSADYLALSAKAK
jgi:arylsulfatase A-like enzyme